MIPLVAILAVLLLTSAVTGCSAASQPESKTVQIVSQIPVEPAPAPSIAPMPTVASTPTATSGDEANEFPGRTAGRSNQPGAQDTVALADTPGSDQGGSATAIASGFVGIAIDISADIARKRALSGSFGAPAEFPAGQRIYAAYLFREIDGPFEIQRVWETVDGLVIGRGSDVILEGNEYLGSANIGARWGIPGGDYILKLSTREFVVGSASFAVDVRIPIFTRFAFASDLDEHLLPVTPGHDFPLGTERVFASLQVFNAPHDLILTAKWTVNGEVVEEQEIMWEAEFDRGPGSFQIISVDSPDAGSPLAVGDHRLMIIRDGREVLNDVFKVG